MNAGFERLEYDVPGLSETDVEADPVDQFRAWFAEAAHLVESNTMILATADAVGKPSARAVLLKAFDERGFVFFTNRRSQKGVELSENPWAEACILWLPLHRQVRIAGPATAIDDAESDAYWATRPRDAQLASAASNQSDTIDSKQSIVDRIDDLERLHREDSIPRPPHWGGMRIAPDNVEFWQGQVSRMHDRLRYSRSGDSWIIERLSP